MHEETFEQKEWEVVGTDIGKWITDLLGAAAGDVTSIIRTIIRTVDNLSSFGSTNTRASNKMQLVEKLQPLNSDDYPCLLAIKIEKKEKEKKAGLKKIGRYSSATKSVHAQIFCIQPENYSAHQKLEKLESNFTSIAKFYSSTFD